MSTKMQVQWRRVKVLELSSQGYSQIEIATQLQVDEPTILDTTTNAGIVSDALKYVTQKVNTLQKLDDRIEEQVEE